MGKCVVKPIHSLVHKLGKWYCKEICKREYKSQVFRRVNERPIEYRFIFEQLTNTCPTTVLDVGAGDTALPSLMRQCGYIVTAIDNVRHYWDHDMINRHYHIIDEDITKPQLQQKFDFVSCVSVLEHIHDHARAVRKMFNLLAAGGHLAMPFPYCDDRYIRNAYALPGAGYGKGLPYICQVFSRNEVLLWLAENHGQLVCQEYWEFFDGEFWTFGRQLPIPRRVDRSQRHQLTCLLLKAGTVNEKVGIRG